MGYWGRDEDGTAAVEFALVGMPFIFLTIGIIELAIMFTAQSVLHEAVFNASRQIRTGTLQTTGGGTDAFRTAICDTAKYVISCSKIQFQVQKYPSFADADKPPTFDTNGNLNNQTFDPGDENDVVLVRVAYNYPIITPLMQPLLADHGIYRTLYSTVVLQTEPYESD